MHLRRGLAVLAMSVLVVGCGGSSGGVADTPSRPSPTVDSGAADKASITQAWQAFFTAGGTLDSHVALLENGESFRAELTAAAKNPSSKDLSAKVTGVVVNGTTAAVTYDLLGKGGAVLLGGASGESVKVANAWLVSKKTYCQLVMLQNSTVPHPGCG